MKKVLTVLFTLIISTIFISGCSQEELKDYTEISYSTFISKKENKEKFPLVIGSSECSACANYKIYMDQFIKKYQVEVFLIDISKLSDEEYATLKTEISFTGTPTTVFYEDGKLTSFYNRIDQVEPLSVITEYFKKNKYIG